MNDGRVVFAARPVVVRATTRVLELFGFVVREISRNEDLPAIDSGSCTLDGTWPLVSWPPKREEEVNAWAFPIPASSRLTESALAQRFAAIEVAREIRTPATIVVVDASPRESDRPQRRSDGVNHGLFALLEALCGERADHPNCVPAPGILLAAYLAGVTALSHSIKNGMFFRPNDGYVLNDVGSVLRLLGLMAEDLDRLGEQHDAELCRATRAYVECKKKSPGTLNELRAGWSELHDRACEARILLEAAPSPSQPDYDEDRGSEPAASRADQVAAQRA